MTVYADILFLINLIVDYFLLRLTCVILHLKPRLWRILLGAVVGGIFSLYIFLPQSHPIVEIIIHILMCAALCLITFSFRSLVAFFRASVVLFCINFAYSGAMIALWLIFRPYGMVINNSVVYFNISPIFLILFSVSGYFLTSLLRRLFAKKFPQSAECEVTLFINGKSLTLSGIIDTGNSIKDTFGIAEIIIVDADSADRLLGNDRHTDELARRYRAIPCTTVGGTEILNGYRIDQAQIIYNNKNQTIKNVIIAISRAPLTGAQAIINPESI